MSQENNSEIQELRLELESFRASMSSNITTKPEPFSESSDTSMVHTRIPTIQTFQASGILTWESNHKTWVRSIRNTDGSDVFTYISTGNAPPTLLQTDLPLWDDYSIKIINAAIDPIKILPLLFEIPDDQVTAFAYWNTLKNRFAPKDSQESPRLIPHFWRIPVIPASEDGFDSWADGATALVWDMRTAKIDFEQLITSHLLASLLPAFESFRATFDLNLSSDINKNDKHYKFEELIELLRIQVRRPNSQSTPSANFTQYSNNSTNKTYSKRRIDFSKPPNSNCPACKNGLHWAKDCANQEKRKAYFNRCFGKKNSANLADTNQQKDSSNSDNDFIGLLASSFLSVQITKSDFILDSGATNHMANNKSYFSSLKVTNPTKVGGISGTINSFGVGNIDMITKQGNHIRLTNVFYIPDLPLNLVSVVYLQTLGITTLFGTNHVKICKNNIDVGTGTTVENGLCKFDSKIKMFPDITANDWN